MKVIIAGSRHCESFKVVLDAMNESPFVGKITEIVSGGARGVDTIGENLGVLMGIPVKRFPAEWDKFGRAAGPKRNRQMAEYADALIAVLYPGSRGTANMIEQAKRLGLKIHVKEMS